MRRHRPKAYALSAAVASLTVIVSTSARAQVGSAVDPSFRPRMSTDGAAVTDVVDAFDVGSVWSFRFSAAFVRSMERGVLQRERSSATEPGENVAPAGVTEFGSVANYARTTQTLNLG